VLPKKEGKQQTQRVCGSEAVAAGVSLSAGARRRCKACVAAKLIEQDTVESRCELRCLVGRSRDVREWAPRHLQ